jgi:hypothetical protein
MSQGTRLDQLIREFERLPKDERIRQIEEANRILREKGPAILNTAPVRSKVQARRETRKK